jgi:hypothetical protein
MAARKTRREAACLEPWQCVEALKASDHRNQRFQVARLRVVEYRQDLQVQPEKVRHLSLHYKSHWLCER